jgi:hypothetical protein
MALHKYSAREKSSCSVQEAGSLRTRGTNDEAWVWGSKRNIPWRVKLKKLESDVHRRWQQASTLGQEEQSLHTLAGFLLVAFVTCGPPVYWTVLPTSWVDLPPHFGDPHAKGLWKHTHRHTQKCVLLIFLGVSNLVKLTTMITIILLIELNPWVAHTGNWGQEENNVSSLHWAALSFLASPLLDSSDNAFCLCPGGLRW